MQPESDSQRWDLEAAELELSLMCFCKPLFEHRDSSSSGCLVINPEVPHHRGHLWFVGLQQCLELPVRGFVSSQKGSLLGIDP